jgi:acetylornithine deacetylase/succinyl-diaminopimelate desuccinylase-like protein
VPSVNGISHNAAEFTEPQDMVMGTNILLQVLIELSNIEDFDS